ncbi:MBL fold metallo-hydrolase [Halococcoides cellulosivorans]|uniref:MBL fold metallo-hydrolase n=1 Tax=Halococcoides cellulosivorans TaxID=1679096 RepID=A0A2R4X229_9EURY|nr:MBL fold metallo-hydrolase [Halococcoides cellulosivorans]AWB27852.1 MBL fold metallo-hydrolase [Halococcoides cellulosivorans]
MELRFLGGAREIGRSALLIDDSLLVDFGLTADESPRLPQSIPDPDAVVASHGHLDHVGAIPALLAGTERPPVHWTPITRDLTRVLAQDTLKLHGGTPRAPFADPHVARLGEVSRVHDYGEPFDAAGYRVTLLDAGHVPGSAHVLIDDGETRLLYTGDFTTADQRLLAGTTARPSADAVVCEATYSDTERPPRGDIESRFVERVERTLWNGGTVLVPAFAIGRTQEVAAILAAADLPCYVDGMGQRVFELLDHSRSMLADPRAFARAKSHARFVSGDRHRIAAESTVIVTTSGMCRGGPVATYLPLVADQPKNTIALTGFQVPGTPGRDLLERGRATVDGRSIQASATVEQFDLSAHADRDGLRAFLADYRDTRVLVTHGDRCESFAESLRADGIDAAAPAVGDPITV